MNVYGYTGVIGKEADGYVSKCPELGVASCGDSFEGAIDNLREAVELYLENASDGKETSAHREYSAERTLSKSLPRRPRR